MWAFMFFQKESEKNGSGPTGFMTYFKKGKRKENFTLCLEV